MQKFLPNTLIRQIFVSSLLLIAADSYACDSTQTADNPDFTRLCEGTVNYSYGLPSYTGDLDVFAPVFGTWGGESDLHNGQSAIFDVPAQNYLSFQFVATPWTTVQLTANTSWGAGGTITVSTSPGVFSADNADLVPGCRQPFNGSNKLTIASNDIHGVNTLCFLVPGQTYYVNIADISNSGVSLCHAVSCSMAYTVLDIPHIFEYGFDN
jgi:hypothetical protein